MVKNEFEWRKLSGSVKVSVWVCEREKKKDVVCVVFVLQRDLNHVVKTGLRYNIAKISFNACIEMGLRYSARYRAIAQPMFFYIFSR